MRFDHLEVPDVLPLAQLARGWIAPECRPWNTDRSNRQMDFQEIS